MSFLMTDVVGSIDGISGNALGPIRGLQLEEGSEAAWKIEDFAVISIFLKQRHGEKI